MAANPRSSLVVGTPSADFGLGLEKTTPEASASQILAGLSFLPNLPEPEKLNSASRLGWSAQA